MSQQTQPSTLSAFDQNRSHLFDIAYRMLGTVMDAEDILQEAYLRWQTLSHEEIVSPQAYLTTMVSRLCIDHLRSAAVRRETYVGPWLPEPLLMHSSTTSELSESSPVDQQTMIAESLSTAFLLLLERLNPIERAIFLLHEVFEYEYDEIAGIVGKSVSNCRQIARRARERVTAERPRFEPSTTKQRRLAENFLSAARSGEMTNLVDMLAEDVVLYSDGGGKVQAARNPIRGSVNVSRFLLGIARRLDSVAKMFPVTANHQPAYITTVDDQVIAVTILQLHAGAIQSIYMIVNPDKLGFVDIYSAPSDA